MVLFASSQVPVGERDTWNPLFLKVMASLQITRDEQLLYRKVVIEVMAQLRERQPEQDLSWTKTTRSAGRNQIVYLSNLFREVRAAPARRRKIIKHFVENLCQPASADFGHEVWDDIRGRIVPVLKPRHYVEREGPTQHLLTTEWLADVVICYAIKTNRCFAS